MSRFFNKVLLFVFLLNCYCYSNDNILWERVPTLAPDSYFTQKCYFSYDEKYIITVHPNWISVYDADNGVPVKNLLFNPGDQIDFRGINDFFVDNKQNILSCKYITNDGYWNLINYDIPNLNVVKTSTIPFWFDSLSSDLKFALLQNFPQKNTFMIYDISKNDTFYIDSAYVYNSTPKKSYHSRFFFSNDSKFLIAAINYDSVLDISLFSLYDKELVKYYSIKRNDDLFIRNIEINDDMEYFVATNSKYISIYKLQTGELIRTIDHPKFISSDDYSVFLKNNKYIASLYEGDKIIIYDIATGNSANEIYCCKNFKTSYNSDYPDHDKIHYILFSKDNSKLLACGKSFNYLIDIISGELISLISSHYTSDIYEEPNFIKFVNSDEYLLIIGISETFIWDSKTGHFVKIMNIAGTAGFHNAITISGDSRQLIFNSEKKILFYNFVDELLENEITTENPVLQLDVSDNGKYIGYTMSDSSFAIYDLEEGSVVYSRKESFNGYHEEDINFYSISLSPNHLCAVTTQSGDKFVGYDYVTRIYDFIEDKLIDEDFVETPVIFLNSDSILLSTGRPTAVTAVLYKYFPDVRHFNIVKRYYPEYPMKSLVVNSTYSHFITSGPTIWNIETGDSIQLHADPELNDMDYVAVSDNGKMLAAMSPEGRIVVWDVEKYFTPVEENPISKENNLRIYPNPAENTVNISYRIETPGIANIFITDVLGNQTLLKSEYKFPGDYVETFNLNVYPQGIYNVVLRSGNTMRTMKVVLLK
ncbi:MAG: T9SS type A sorting domain-containing protein [bacterium]